MEDVVGWPAMLPGRSLEQLTLRQRPGHQPNRSTHQLKGQIHKSYLLECEKIPLANTHQWHIITQKCNKTDDSFNQKKVGDVFVPDAHGRWEEDAHVI